MASFQFGYESGLWALAFLIPLILLYLIKPKPKTMPIPSLMFFMRSSGYRKLTSFLRQIVRDWLFVIQLLLLLSLALTFAQPFTTYYKDVTASNTVIVLDVSASSQTHEGLQTRFEKSVAKAKSILSARNTIILAKDVPLIGVKEAGYDEAYRFLQSLKPKDTTTRLGEAILLAGEALSEGRVTVISDFINTDGQDPQIAKTVLESKGIKVEFISTTGEKRSNVGIVDMIADESSTTVYVKNYDDVQRKIKLTTGKTTQDLSIAAHATETSSLKTPEGITKISIDYNDDFPTDNTVYLSAPDKKQIKAMLITNNASIFLKNALTASGDVSLDMARPPIVPKDKYDVYIIQNIDTEQILPGTFEDIIDKVKDGATAIVHVQEQSQLIDYKGLLPVKLGIKRDGGSVRVDQLNRFTKNIEFGSVDYYFTSVLKEGTINLASIEDNGVISVGKQGDGKIIYFGMPEKASDFKFSPSYPIFWTELIRFATEQQEIKNLNYHTGDTLLFEGNQKVETPTTTLKQPTVMLEEAGIYKMNDRTIAVNLLREKESDINSNVSFGTKSVQYELKPVREERKYSLEFLLTTIGLLLLIFEVLFIKWRGDL